jgi:hypothetical protein
VYKRQLLTLATYVSAQSAFFKAQVIDKKIGIGYGLATGDVDGDGYPDILMADNTDIVWYKNPGTREGSWTRYVIAHQLTPKDNVCIAARDIDGDGKVEVAIGAQWAPGETKNPAESGAVFYLYPTSDDRTQPWKAVRLHHEVTVHRMHWIKTTDNAFQLVVLPLHGLNNVNSEGTPVNMIVYDVPKDRKSNWPYQLVNTRMHATHNFQPIEVPNRLAGLAVGGKQGVQLFLHGANGWAPSGNWFVSGHSIGEVRNGILSKTEKFTATIELMHCTMLVVNTKDTRTVISDQLRQGHGLVCADFLGQGRDQIAVGWREKNAKGHLGVRFFVGQDEKGTKWQEYSIDDSVEMACEDLVAADLDQDGKLDLIASGRATKNVVIYWNQRP